jgi:uncharacterized protein with GYD domain
MSSRTTRSGLSCPCGKITRIERIVDEGGFPKSLSATSKKAAVDKPQDRRPAARAALEAAGYTLADYYFALGPANIIVIYEAPDTLRGFVSIMLGALGTASSVEIVQLFTTEEAMTAITKTGQVQKS